MAEDGRSRLIVVAGGTTTTAAEEVEGVIARVVAARPGTAVLHHDLAEVGQGVVRRRLRTDTSDDGAPDGRGPVADVVDLRGVVTVLDVASWLADAGSDDEVAERGLAPLPDDERTIAQLVVAQAEFADLLVLAGEAEPWLLGRTEAVLARLAPRAPRLAAGHLAPSRSTGTRLDPVELLEELPAGARRGRPDVPHAALLSGQPPLEADGDVRLFTFGARRPFHPERLPGGSPSRRTRPGRVPTPVRPPVTGARGLVDRPGRKSSPARPGGRQR